MSRLDKLSILGVRSFGPVRNEVVTIFTPLTLIVGHNGTGKTTIIECLRYATTGELPPNSTTGGAWIHDPKLCGENEVLAQVKLSFYSTRGLRMVTTRSLQLTVKKSQRSQKTLEGHLNMVKDGERTSVSHRVAELDQIIPQYFGVSKAILENVIFCHQDESLWPMSAPAILKKKFDEIFEAYKYTKAIENIKSIRKKHMEELGKQRIVEHHAKEDKDKGAKNEKKSEKLWHDIDELRKEHDDITKKSSIAKEKAQEAWDSSVKFNKIVAELHGKRIRADALQQGADGLKKSMKEMHNTDEELLEMERGYEERVTLYAAEEQSWLKKYTACQEALNQFRQTLGSTQGNVGTYRAQKEHYESQLERIQQLVKESARRHNIRGFDGNYGELDSHEFIERLGKLSREHQSMYDKARRESQTSLSKAQEALSQLTEKRLMLNQTKENCKHQVNANDTRVAQLRSQIDQIDVDEGLMAVLESQIQELEQQLGRVKGEASEARWDENIRTADSSLKKITESKDQLEAEMLQSSRQAKELARYEFLRKELKTRQESLDTMVKTHNSSISNILGDEWTPETLDETFQHKASELSTSVKDAEKQRDGISREQEQITFQLESLKATLEKKRRQLNTHEETIRAAIDDEPSEYPSVLQQLEENLVTVNADMTSFQVMKEYYESCMTFANQRNACRLCERLLKDREKEPYMKKLEKKLEKALKDMDEEEKEKQRKELDVAKEVQPNYQVYLQLIEEIPRGEEESRSLEKQVGSLSDNLEHWDQEVKLRGSKKIDLEAISRTVQSITKYFTEIGSFRQQISELETVQKSASQVRTTDELEKALENVKEELRRATTELNQLRTRRDGVLHQINKMEIEIRDLRSKLSTTDHQLKEKHGLESQISGIRDQNQQQQDALRKADLDLQTLNPQISEAQESLEDVRRRAENKERELQAGNSAIAQSLHQLKVASEETNAYVQRGGPQQLANALREVEKLEEEISKQEQELRQTAAEINKIKEEKRNHEDTKRSIADNLKYRETQKQLHTLEREIAELEAKNAAADKERLELEANKWQTEHERLSAESAHLVGRIKSMDDQLKDLLKEWETDYQHAGYKYREAHVQVEVTKAAVEDLGRYAGALDKAIMKFHSLKMEEINRIIEELWRKTYRGSDVDTIMIRSENETQRGNKSYNYRVVMVKQDAEMDMRGRCSAGQKVLASIIIRLALAECFGVNCGLIALDEPTTNLDRENIKSLAESLYDLIQLRRQQSNFQLIVITHDEEFLRYMKCSDFCEYYFRVFRNEEQKSQVRKQRISEVCG